MAQKFLFFDIDGTLVNFQGEMPQSAKTALRRAQEYGHKIFLCTGRGKGQIYPFLLDFGFDGIVAGTGAYVEDQGEVLRDEGFGEENMDRMVRLFEEEDIPFMIQGTKDVTVSAVNALRLLQSLGLPVKSVTAAKRQMKAALGRVIYDDDLSGYAKKYAGTQDVMYVASPLSREEVSAALGDELEVLPPSFNVPRDDQGEITLRAINKPDGIACVMQREQVRRENVIAFGDADNDLRMLQFAGTGVAMGNAVPHLKEAADYVTTDIDDDGIYHAMEHLGLI